MNPQFNPSIPEPGTVVTIFNVDFRVKAVDPNGDFEWSVVLEDADGADYFFDVPTDYRTSDGVHFTRLGD